MARSNPFTSVFAVIPGTAMPFRATGFWVGTGGDVFIRCADNTTALLKNVASGSEIPGEVIYIGSAGEGTTAADIVGFRYLG